MSRLMIGVDIGTTSTKAVAYTPAGQVVAHHAVDYPLLRPMPDAAEQDPEVILRAVVEALRQVAQAGTVVGVSFSAAMHSLIAIDADSRPLTRSITWADNRAATWAERIKADADPRTGGNAIYRRTGTPIHPMSPLVKLAWLRHDEPALFERAARFVGIKEYVFFRLFGGWWIDHSIASATGLLESSSLDWDDGALAVAGVRREQLSALVPTTHRVEGLGPDIAQATGLAPDTPFIVGANDGVLSNLGVDAIAPGEVAATIGTSGALRAVVGRPLTDPSGRTFCYALTERHWVVGGPVNNGGVILRWLRDELASSEAKTAGHGDQDTYEALSRIAERVPAGSAGLLFHPYLAGERAPLWNADLRGSYFGLAMHHRKEHLIRAVFEGVMCNLYSILPAVESLVGTSTAIKATGGFARSAMWRQMMADVFDREVVVPASFESSCLGAAVLGLHALGLVQSLDVVSTMVGATHRHRPDAKNAAVYRRLLPIFLALPGKLQDEYRAIAAFQRETSAHDGAA
ncbi:MAG: gluconokinase [Proteobacteria bacterium]|nr:gluconokinase [Pseudomonadota bacterium]